MNSIKHIIQYKVKGTNRVSKLEMSLKVNIWHDRLYSSIQPEVSWGNVFKKCCLTLFSLLDSGAVRIGKWEERKEEDRKQRAAGLGMLLLP